MKEPMMMPDDLEWRYDEAPHVCEQHPMKAWPHGDCPGPGVALSREALLFDVVCRPAGDGAPE